MIIQMTKMTRMNQKEYNSYQHYTYRFAGGDVIRLQAISPHEYRLLTDLPELATIPEPPIQNFYDRRTDQWVVFDYSKHVEYERVSKLYDQYVTAETVLQRQIAIEYVIDKGVIDVPDDIMDVEGKKSWLLDKCKTFDEYLDVIDAIVGINMATESGVQAVLKSYQSIILDHGEAVPLTDWESRKERKGGLIMSLHAEGLLACGQMNGAITLKQYFNLPGDPRYVKYDAPMPLSKCHIIGLNRLNVKSSNATQEIEMEDRKTDEYDSPFAQ